VSSESSPDKSRLELRQQRLSFPNRSILVSGNDGHVPRR
jgi:hypothetical protein